MKVTLRHLTPLCFCITEQFCHFLPCRVALISLLTQHVFQNTDTGHYYQVIWEPFYKRAAFPPCDSPPALTLCGTFVGLFFWKPERQTAFWNTALQTSNFLQMQGCDWCTPYWHPSTLSTIPHLLFAPAYINRPKNRSGISLAMPHLLPHPVRTLAYNSCVIPESVRYIRTVSTEKKTHDFRSVHKSLNLSPSSQWLQPSKSL